MCVFAREGVSVCMVKAIIGEASHSVVGASHFTWTLKPCGFANSSLAYRLLFNKLGGRLGSPFSNYLAMLMKWVRNMFLHCCFSLSPQYVTARNFCLTCWSIFEVSSLQKWKELFLLVFSGLIIHTKRRISNLSAQNTNMRLIWSHVMEEHCCYCFGGSLKSRTLRPHLGLGYKHIWVTWSSWTLNYRGWLLHKVSVLQDNIIFTLYVF